MPSPMDSEPQLLVSDREREESPPVAEDEITQLVQGNTGFALDLFDEVRDTDSNLLVSPYSISVALSMTWAGARGTTEAQIADALRYPFGQETLHPAFNALGQSLENNGEEADHDNQPFQLELTNSIWGQEAYPFSDAYLDTLAVNYGAGLRVLDFKSNPEAARTEINEWVEEQTNEKIKELLPSGSISELTRLALVNAVYFKADWKHTFEKEATEDGTFTALDGSQSTVPMMRQSTSFPYAETDGHQLIELPYVGDSIGMVVVLPADGAFESFERSLDANRLTSMLDSLQSRAGEIVLPRFTYDSTLNLKKTLSALGMEIAFDENRADFTGMAESDHGEDLFISDVVQKSHIAVDEKGTEAAAATGVVVSTTSAPIDPFEMIVNRPFIHLIRDRETGTILFLGRVTDAGRAQ